MKNKGSIRPDIVLFNLILIIWLAMFSISIATSSNVNMIQFVLASCLTICMAVSYNVGLVTGLLASLLFVFFYGTFLLYGVLVTGTIGELRVDYVVWFFWVPLLTFLAGKLSNHFFQLECQNESYVLLNNLLTIDELTGFLNQRGFLRTLEQETSEAKRFNTNLSVLLLTVTNLQEMHSLYGKKGIEEINKTIAKTIETTLRVVDIKGLVDAETFAIILPGTPLAGATQVEEKLLTALERIPVELDGKKKVLQLRLRIGKAEYQAPEEALVFFERAKESSNYNFG